MITLDKIKLVTKPDYIEILKEDKFEKYTNNGKSAMVFSMKTPFDLLIRVTDMEMTIEFTGKILGKNYPSLISLETIEDCFNSINSIGICHVDADKVINDSEVVKCDVTKDFYCDNITGLTTLIQSMVKNRNLYFCKMIRGGSISIEKNVVTKNLKKRITIYDKEREMNRIEGIRYMEQNQIDKNIYSDKCRAELNLNSKEQIRNALQIPETSLLSVLKSNAEPIEDFLNEILVDYSSSAPLTTKKEYLTSLVLRDCGYDLSVVEAKLRALMGKDFHPKREMEPYQKMMREGTTTNEFSKQKVIDMIRGVAN